MKNLPLNRFPTSTELYALELEARRMRAAYIAQLLRAATAGWRSLWAPKAVKGLRHA
jgi:hypothetical protein